MQVVVLGMHRSGTSALTSLLAGLGCYAGPAGSLPPPSAWNQRGFWEHPGVAALNEDLLGALGASWYDLLGIDVDQLDGARGARLVARGRALVAELDRHRPWVIKDPRLCVLLPFWRPLLERPVCVLTHRDPLAIARSLQKREGFPIVFGLALWELHVRAALAASAGLPRLVTSYRSLVSDPPAAAAELRARLTALGIAGLKERALAGAAESIDGALQHHATDVESHQEYLNAEQMALCESLATGQALSCAPRPLSRGAHDLLRLYPPAHDARETLLATARLEASAPPARRG